MSELNQLGVKKRSYVYAGGEVVAKQEGNQVLWDNRDASGRSTRTTNSSATVTSRVELDPLSVAVDPTNVPEGNSPYSISPVGFYGTPQEPNLGCSEDGAPADCNKAQRDRREGIAAQCPNNSCGPMSIDGQWYSYHYTDNGAGWMTNNQFFGIPTTGPPRLGSLDPNRPRDTAIELPLRSPRYSPFNIAPQETDPRSLGSHVDNVCSLLVEFRGPGFKQNNGPGDSSPGLDVYGLGFTVSGVVADGAIGRVEYSKDRVDIVNPQGNWTIQQWASYSFKLTRDRDPNYLYFGGEATHLDGPDEAFRRVEGNTFVYSDYPGPVKKNVTGNLTYAEHEFDFDIKLINGSQQCEVRFHISMLFQQGKFAARWRPQP